jgi:hypothetical protein
LAGQRAHDAETLYGLDLVAGPGRSFHSLVEAVPEGLDLCWTADGGMQPDSWPSLTATELALIGCYRVAAAALAVAVAAAAAAIMLVT